MVLFKWFYSFGKRYKSKGEYVLIIDATNSYNTPPQKKIERLKLHDRQHVLIEFNQKKLSSHPLLPVTMKGSYDTPDVQRL